jgi:hypothetical protein
VRRAAVSPDSTRAVVGVLDHHARYYRRYGAATGWLVDLQGRRPPLALGERVSPWVRWSAAGHAAFVRNAEPLTGDLVIVRTEGSTVEVSPSAGHPFLFIGWGNPCLLRREELG